jgi:hypothetical protein
VYTSFKNKKVKKIKIWKILKKIIYIKKITTK